MIGRRIIAGAVCLVVPMLALADLTNTARVSYRDNSGNARMAASNAVTVVVGAAFLPAPTLDLSAIKVFPNPWRADQHSSEPVTFDHLTAQSTVKIFTVSGRWVKTLPPADSMVPWDLTNDAGAKVASGLYVYLITTPDGQKRHGQCAVIR